MCQKENKIYVCGPNKDDCINFIHKFLNKIPNDLIEILNSVDKIPKDIKIMYLILLIPDEVWMKFYFKVKENNKIILITKETI